MHKAASLRDVEKWSRSLNESRAKRDEAIRTAFYGGAKQEEISVAAGLSRSRIQGILSRREAK